MKRSLFCVLLLILSSVASSEEVTFPDPSRFPLPENYRHNVNFWMRVYGEWNDDVMIIHDSLNMGVVFETVKIPKDNELLQAAARTNLKNRVETIKRMLRDLQNNPNSTTLSEEHKKIRDLYQNISRPNKFREAADNVRIQQGIRNRFEQGLERMTMYLDQIKRVFREEGMPEDLGYLPLVESSFNNQSLSKTRAAGIWQFMPGTARLYMKVNSDVDERLDPPTATRAAARYLKRSHQMFASWPVSLMSYNHGQAGMANAIKSLGTNDFMTIVTRYQGKSFGFASRNFYAEFLAACKVMRSAEKYFDAIHYARPLESDSIRLSSPLYVSTIVNHSSVSTEDLRTHNPALQSSIIFSRRPVPAGYNLHFPEGKIKDLVTFVAELRKYGTPPQKTIAVAKKNEPPARKSKSSTKTASSKTYVVKRGDTLFSISRKFATTVDAIRRMNGLDHSNIFPGQKLFVSSR